MKTRLPLLATIFLLSIACAANATIATLPPVAFTPSPQTMNTPEIIHTLPPIPTSMPRVATIKGTDEMWNIRECKGIHCDIISQRYSGDSITILFQSYSNGALWYRIRCHHPQCWIHSDAIQPQSPLPLGEGGG
jgi:hypothetical protein